MRMLLHPCLTAVVFLLKPKGTLPDQARYGQVLRPACPGDKRESLRTHSGLDKDHSMPQISAEVDVAGSRELPTGRGKHTCPKDETVLDDMEVFVSLGKNLKQFVQHMELVGSWENGLKDNSRCRTALKTVKLLSL